MNYFDKEEVSVLLHLEWQDFLNHLFNEVECNENGSMTIPADIVERWRRQKHTDFEHLSDTEKDLYRKNAQDILCALEQIKWRNSLAVFRKK